MSSSRVKSQILFYAPVEEMETPTWIEPSYPIVREERFNEDIIKDILINPDLPKNDKKHLQLYYRKRSDVGRYRTSYDLAPAYKDSGLGRLYGVSLGTMRWDIRNPLADGNSIDVDIANCHWVIAETFAKRYRINHECISEVVNNRDAVLKSIHDDRDIAKTQVLLAICYGGKLTLYDEHLVIKPFEVKPGCKKFLADLTKEIQTLSTLIYDDNTAFHNIRCTDGKLIKNQDKPKSTMMALIFQREERYMLMALAEALGNKGRYMSRFIHDGGHVDSLFPEEKELSEEIMNYCEEHITECTGYKVKLTCKPITHNWKPRSPTKDAYEAMKAAFEKNTCLVGPLFWRLESNGSYSQYKVADMRTMTSTLIITEETPEGKIKKVKFLDRWLEDPKGKRYNRADFYPNASKCPEDVFNLFTGFKGEEYDDEHPQEAPDHDAYLVEPIITHLNYLTNGYAHFACMWLADIINNPASNSAITILLRDMGTMLQEGGGTGKSWFLDWVSREILGEKYCVTITDNAQLYSSFNSFLENKLLVIIEEASGKENHQHANTFKSMTGTGRMMINKKGVAQYNINSFIRFIALTNDKNAMPIRHGDRRFAAFDTNPEMRGNTKYFNDLHEVLADGKVKAAFFRYLKSYDVPKSPIDFFRSIPITECYRELKRINAGLMVKWILHLLESGQIPEGVKTDDLYKQFAIWATESRERKSDSLMSAYQFSCNLGDIGNDASDDGFGGCVINGIVKNGTRLSNLTKAYYFDVPAIIDSFESQYLIQKGKEYIAGTGLMDKETTFAFPLPTIRRKRTPPSSP